MTDTTPATVDATTFDVSRTVLIRADRARVWDALTVPELLSEWFGDQAHFDALAPGAAGRLIFDGFGDFPIEIVEVEEPTVLAFRWSSEPDIPLGPNSTLVRFTLAETPDGTLLTVVESGFDVHPGDDARRRALADGNREGWDEELDELAAVLEKQDSV